MGLSSASRKVDVHNADSTTGEKSSSSSISVTQATEDTATQDAIKTAVEIVAAGGQLSTEATLLLIKAKTDNLDVALSDVATEATLAAIKLQTDKLSFLGTDLKVVFGAPKPTYRVTATVGTGLIGNNITIRGSATKTVKILKVNMVQTVSATIRGTALMRGRLLSASTAGINVVPVSLDSTNLGVTATASSNATIPTPAGNIDVEWIEMDDAGAIGRARRKVGFSFGETASQPVVLRGIAEFFQVNVEALFDGLVGGSADIVVEFTEE